MRALNENVRNKNIQISELNRKLKANNEFQNKQSRMLNKRNRDLMAQLKQLEQENEELKNSKNVADLGKVDCYDKKEDNKDQAAA